MFAWLKKLFGARKAKSSKVTVHFFHGHQVAIDPKLLKPMARDISKQEKLPDSCLFFYQVHPWPKAAKNTD